MDAQIRTASIPGLFDEAAPTHLKAVGKAHAPLNLRGQFLVLGAESALVLAVLGTIFIFAL